MNSSTQKIPITAESSIIRSILKKKRASLGRRSQTSDQKGTKATKKVLFEMFENVEVEDKENELSLSVIKNQSDSDFGPLDEPTVFLNFPKSRLLESSPMENIKDVNSSNFMRPESCGNANIVGNILKVWKDYMENFNILRSERNSLENSFQIYVDQSLTFQNQLKSYFKTRDEIYNKFSELEAEVEENLRKTLENGNEKVFPKSRKNSLEGKSREKLDKIKLSEKSKAIKKSTGKSNRILKTDLWMEADDSFTLVEKKQVKALL